MSEVQEYVAKLIPHCRQESPGTKGNRADDATHLGLRISAGMARLQSVKAHILTPVSVMYAAVEGHRLRRALGCERVDCHH